MPSSRAAAEPSASLYSGIPKRMTRRDTELGHQCESIAEPVERELVLARHRRDLALEVFSMIDKQGVDQVVHRQLCSREPGREAGDGRGAAGADRADNGRRAQGPSVLPRIRDD